MAIFEQILFIIVIGSTSWILFRRIQFIRKNILNSRPLKRSDNWRVRAKNVLLVAFGQKKMFKRPLAAILHLMVYAGFLIVNIEGLEFVIDGLTGHHRSIADLLQSLGWISFYNIMLNVFEFMAVLVILACVFFLVRRNVLKVPRFHSVEMTQWPKLDANLILIFEIVLMFAILTMNASDQILQHRDVAGYPHTGTLVFSETFATPFYRNIETPTLIVVERLAWWAHIIGIFLFAIYVTYSKHLHTFMAFPNTYYANLNPRGAMPNMPEVTAEVKNMLGLPDAPPPVENIPRMGAKDVNDLHWVNIMNAYTCTECGRCTSACPANMTGKKLSPRKIMMDVRDRAEELGRGKNPDHTLLGHYITKEELFACTTCNACVEECPVLIDPLDIIMQLRRYIVLEESGAPGEWNNMFANIETNFAPWKFSASDRFNWKVKE